MSPAADRASQTPHFILAAIVLSVIEAAGGAPMTAREAAAACGWHLRSVQNAIRRLHARGALSRDRRPVQAIAGGPTGNSIPYEYRMTPEGAALLDDLRSDRPEVRIDRIRPMVPAEHQILSLLESMGCLPVRLVAFELDLLDDEAMRGIGQLRARGLVRRAQESPMDPDGYGYRLTHSGEVYLDGYRAGAASVGAA